jgi:hypothetical protein
MADTQDGDQKIKGKKHNLPKEEDLPAGQKKACLQACCYQQIKSTA